jgi:hypothetical protein
LSNTLFVPFSATYRELKIRPLLHP